MANQNLISLEQDDRIGQRLRACRWIAASSCNSAPPWRRRWACRRGGCRGCRGSRHQEAAERDLAALECPGCTESILRAEHPTLEKLILDVISLDYHETLFAAAGHQVEAARKTAMAENRAVHPGCRGGDSNA
jgi:hydrogenase small subunit